MPSYRLLLIISYVLAATAPSASQDAAKEAEEGYMVIINHEEQYSIWPRQKIEQPGTKISKESCSLRSCREYIEEVWTDMRPLSLKKTMASKGIDAEKTKYRVIINHEEQYSLASLDGSLPKGWKPAGKTCSLAECRTYIQEVWTDMRPLSIREE